jgi:hypothetical protein
MKYMGKKHPYPAVHIAVFLLQHTLLTVTTTVKSDPAVELMCIKVGLCV